MPRYLIYERQPSAPGFSPALYAARPVIKHGRIARADGVGPRVHGDPVEITDDAMTLDQAVALHPCGAYTPEIHTGPDQAEPHRNAVALIDPPAAWTDVLAERQRQVAVEGWDAAHDDEHNHGELATVASCYIDAHNPCRVVGSLPSHWPRSWDESWWKPTSHRRDLVKAAALLLAEIERIDRAGGDDHG